MKTKSESLLSHAEQIAEIERKYAENLEEKCICGTCGKPFTKYLRGCPHCQKVKPMSKLTKGKTDCESCGRVMDKTEGRWAFIYPEENDGPTAQDNCQSCMNQPLRVLRAVEAHLKRGNVAKAKEAIQEFAEQVDDWEEIELEA